LKIYKKEVDKKKSSIMKIDEKDGYTHALIRLKNGKTRIHEFHYGSGYLSQSSLDILLSSEVKSVVCYKGNIVQKTVTFIQQN